MREISIEVDLRNIKSTAVIEFCTQQKQLKTLSCRILGSTKLFICLFLTQILENCIALRNIDVTYNDIVFISYELFKKLLCSDLQSLGFQCKEVSLARKITEEKELPLNSTLHALTLHTSYGVGDWFKLLLIKKFCNLKYLELHEVTDILLRAIWEYQVSLSHYIACSLLLRNDERKLNMNFRNILQFLMINNFTNIFCMDIKSCLSGTGDIM